VAGQTATIRVLNVRDPVVDDIHATTRNQWWAGAPTPNTCRWIGARQRFLYSFERRSSMRLSRSMPSGVHSVSCSNIDVGIYT